MPKAYLRLGITVNNSPHEDSHVVLSLVLHDIVGGRQKPDILDGKASFLKNFTRRTVLKGLAELEMTAGQCESTWLFLKRGSFRNSGVCEVTCTMASLSLADDELALGVEDEHAYADSWVHHAG